jgi:rhodanese-related sulfurtransferase
MVNRTLQTALGQLVLIATLAAIGTAWTYHFHPRRPALHLAPPRPPAPGVTFENIRTWEIPPVWIDTRPPAAFSSGHVEGALSLPSEDVAAQITAHFETFTDRRRPFVLYGPADAVEAVMERLRGLGLTRVHRLGDDWRTWNASQP